MILTRINTINRFSPALNMRTLLGGYFIAVCMLSGYFPIQYLFFSSPDDRWMLLKNELVHPDGFSLEYLYEVFRAPGDIQYSPVNTLYYYLIYCINGYDPYYYHLFSLLLHAANVWVVYKLAKETLMAFFIENPCLIAYFTAFVWAIHPLNVESVAWISASKVLLFSLFSLLSCWLFVKGILANRPLYLISSIILFIVSCFCKEQSLVTPLMFLLFVVCYKMNNREYMVINWQLVATLTISVLIAVVFGIVFMKLNAGDSGFVTPMVQYSFFERMILSFYCLRFYLTSFLIPAGLHFHYGYPFPKGGHIPVLYFVYPLLFIGFSYFLYMLIRHATNKYFYFFCLGTFLIQIGLVLQVIPMTRRAIMADRYMYIPLIPLLMVLMEVAVNFLPWHLGRNKVIRSIPAIVLIAAIVTYTLYTNELAHYWASLNMSGYGKK